ncbi:MAG: acyl carrier protein [Pseudohongiellaceae bacterium]
MKHKTVEASVYAELRAALGHGIPADGIQAETRLTELPLDSLSLLEVIYELENRFEVTVDESQLAALTTVNDLVIMIGKAAAQGCRD